MIRISILTTALITTLYYLVISSNYYIFFVVLILAIVLLYELRISARPIGRNYPILFRVYHLFHKITDYAPYSRETVNYITESTEKKEDISFGIKEIHENYIAHTSFPIEVDKIDKVIIGKDCKIPYEANRINISAMGFGPLSKNAILSLCKASNMFDCFINTGEDGYSRFHNVANNVVIQLGQGYFGYQDKKGHLDRKIFKEKSSKENVSMIEIKLSQGGKPGIGSNLPGSKVNALVAETQNEIIGQDIKSKPYHSEFSNWKELLIFIKEIRELSGGKPVGVKICIGKKDEFELFIKTIVEQKTYPNFITIDGSEGGSGASSYSLFKGVGMPLHEAIEYVDGLLKKYDMRSDIVLLASGKLSTPYDIFHMYSLGADICNIGRATLIALGCEQALKCHTGYCPSGLATQNLYLQSGITINNGTDRVFNYFQALNSGVTQLMGASGYRKIQDMHNSSPFQTRKSYHD